MSSDSAGRPAGAPGGGGRPLPRWLPAVLHAAPIALLVLGLFYYWFGVADRYAVFLYGHLGATAFDTVTTGRYWMSGLVAGGVVLAGHTTFNWLAGRASARYQPPRWSHVWLASAPCLLVGIPLITTTAGEPALPLHLAVTCALAAVAGLALALFPAGLAARRPVELLWLLGDGLGLVPVLLLLRVAELPGTLRSVDARTAAVSVLLSLVLSAAWLGIMTLLRERWGPRRQWPGAAAAWGAAPHPSLLMPAASMFMWYSLGPPAIVVPSAGSVLGAGLACSYLLTPLVHHVAFTPAGFKYISAAGNFFASGWPAQLAVLVTAAVMALAVTRFRYARQGQRPHGGQARAKRNRPGTPGGHEAGLAGSGG